MTNVVGQNDETDPGVEASLDIQYIKVLIALPLCPFSLLYLLYVFDFLSFFEELKNEMYCY